MKRSIVPVIATVIALAAGTGQVLAQGNLKIAVVDMQQALTDYNRTKKEVDAINEFGEAKNKGLDEKKADLKKITDQMLDLQKIAAETANGEDKRKKAAEDFQKLARERNAKLKEIADDERKLAEEILKMRQEMEATLVEDIRKVMTNMAQTQGIDLIFDKSFLPKANKAIIFLSDNVTDLTKAIVDELNK